MAKKILIIDDDKGILEIFKMALMNSKFEVLTAGDGNEGLEIIKENPPDLIVLDIMMPSMNGYEFLRTLKGLRAVEGNGMIPVIVMTAKQGMEELFKFEGVDHYLVKPVQSADLINKINECLGSDD